MRTLVVALMAIIGGVLVLPTTAFADPPAQVQARVQAQAPDAPTTTTAPRRCAGVTPQDSVAPVTLEVTLTTRTWTTPLPPDMGTVSFSVTRGVATVTAPDGQRAWYLLHYRSLQQIGGPTLVTGRDLLGGGAMSDVLYLEGGTADVANDGAAGITSGSSIDVCVALGA